MNEYSRLESVKEEIRARVDTQVDAYGGTYYTQTVEEVNPQIFAWLDLLDMNVWVILFLMTGWPIHHDIRFADYHSGAYQYDRGAESFAELIILLFIIFSVFLYS